LTLPEASFQTEGDPLRPPAFAGAGPSGHGVPAQARAAMLRMAPEGRG